MLHTVRAAGVPRSANLEYNKKKYEGGSMDGESWGLIFRQ